MTNRRDTLNIKELDNLLVESYIHYLNNPISFGERAQSRFERGGFCIIGGR
jgi:hypothetical protein